MHWDAPDAGKCCRVAKIDDGGWERVGGGWNEGVVAYQRSFDPTGFHSLPHPSPALVNFRQIVFFGKVSKEVQIFVQASKP